MLRLIIIDRKQQFLFLNICLFCIGSLDVADNSEPKSKHPRMDMKDDAESLHGASKAAVPLSRTGVKSTSNF